jgi:hypothetical protein
VITNVSEESIASVFRIEVKMEAIRFSETLVIIYKTAWRHKPENHDPKFLTKSVRH